jgi:hypothetical protein
VSGSLHTLTYAPNNGRRKTPYVKKNVDAVSQSVKKSLSQGGMFGIGKKRFLGSSANAPAAFVGSYYVRCLVAPWKLWFLGSAFR